MNKLSHSKIDKYLECPRKYRNYYVEKIRPINKKSALIYGSVLDTGLNALHQGKTLDEAKKIFLEEWSKYEKDPEITYSKADVDEILLKHFDINYPGKEGWWSLLYKGYLMLEACVREVLPMIKNVISVQENISFKNDDGDEVNGILDLIVESHQGKIYLMDNKSSSVKYADDSPRKSQQLVLYYYIKKDLIKIDEIGFFVYNKKINLGKIKTCQSCKTVNKSSHRTCNEMINVSHQSIPDKFKRCGGEFDITYNPRAEVDLITNEVAPSDEDRVIEDIDKANQGIANQEFEPNYEACEGKFGRCEYYNLCHGGSMEGLKVEKKKDEV